MEIDWGRPNYGWAAKEATKQDESVPYVRDSGGCGTQLTPRKCVADGKTANP